ncbi:MAG TPA: tripartite tricarboxylate transporter TctB family protein [Alphaproteobacteria bacterium]|jgi:putative tricarboxylic transport membrane protein|nr:tripartite tricarboxylate transporter TctB family protein [Alphaproteobacteria bacterium]HBP74126.1 tripartite tricarboxylate transporter TctB family protein [Alphaproteobacteria bacterium]HCD79297.1 tripartite tricarboxylate transporter TctB family protein [Alphaproteobacteria bacterium]|tara:strand:- start:418 stop:855 length:438 start_codon:yes stop_codon:yes gene_type:complete
MSDRITGLIVAVLALAFAASASQLEEPFFADPLGPKAFPLLISAISFVAAATMLMRPDAEPAWPGLATLMRLAIATIILVAYAYALKPLGFLLPTGIASAALSYQIRPRLRQSVVIGLALSVGLFVIFKYALGLGLFALPRWLMV